MALGVPVWNLLGGPGARPHPHLRARQHARGGLEPGRGGIRPSVRRRVRPGAQGRLREAVGDEMDIADRPAVGPPWLTPGDAVQVARALEPRWLLFIEDPGSPREPGRLPAHPRQRACRWPRASA